MKKVVLAGYYGMYNTGDEAILAATVGALRDARGDLEIVVLSADPVGTSAAYNVKASHRMSPAGVIGALFGADLVLFGGGSLLQDLTSRRSLLYYVTILDLARRLGRRVMVYANGVGPVRWEAGRKMVARAVSRADAITVRDEESALELRAMGVSGRDIVVTADPAFLLTPGSAGRASAMLSSCGLTGGRVLWLSLRPVRSEEWAGEVVSLIRDARSRDLEPAFLLMQETHDGFEASRINSLIQDSGEPAVPVVRAPGPQDALALVGLGRFLIGMRLHAVILAAMAGVPAAGVELDPKISSFLKVAGLPSIQAPGFGGTGRLCSVLDELVGKAGSIQKSLTEKVPEFRRLARKNLDIALSLLDA